jgi:hypothetical protein
VEFRKLQGVNSADALEFFFNGLQETPPAEDFNIHEARYVASVLAHYSLTSCFDVMSMPAPRSMVDVIDNFILKPDLFGSQEILITAGSQCLFMGGFFRDQVKRKHNIRWIEQCGSTFFARASAKSKTPSERRLYGGLSHNFRPWSFISGNFHKRMRLERFLIEKLLNQNGRLS